MTECEFCARYHTIIKAKKWYLVRKRVNHASEVLSLSFVFFTGSSHFSDSVIEYTELWSENLSLFRLPKILLRDRDETVAIEMLSLSACGTIFQISKATPPKAATTRNITSVISPKTPEKWHNVNLTFKIEIRERREVNTNFVGYPLFVLQVWQVVAHYNLNPGCRMARQILSEVSCDVGRLRG